ncbi:MAG: hypothetical protein IJU91_08040 [Selenomonadaceae bacterium]|nr:hypothetical protein [Selenomonadaceae bacterium]
MLKRFLTLIVTVLMLIGFTTANAATPKYSADKAILAYAELYTFGTSEHMEATGLPKDFAYEKITKPMKNHIMVPFKNYPLNKENFEKVQSAYAEKIRSLIKISTRLKKDDKENPVVEITANHFDQEAIDAYKNQNADFVTMDVMRHMNTPAELASDGQFQKMALMSLLGIVSELTVRGPATFDVTCKMIEDDNGDFYWMPQDISALSEFVDPLFIIRETDPLLIDALIAQIFSGAGVPEENSGENPSAENNSAVENNSNAESTAEK